MAARRWYLLVPLVLASVGVAYFAYTQMPAVYTASVVHQINGPASAANGSSGSGSAGGESTGGEPSDGDGTSNSFTTATALAAQLAKDLQPPGARGRQTPPPYTLTAQPDAPMLTVRADGDSAAKALASVTAVSQRLVTQLATLQNDQRVPASAQLKLDTPVPAAVAPPVRTTGIKVFAATLLFGLMLSVLLAAAVERSARQRRALLAEDSDELDDGYDRSDEGAGDRPDGRSDEYNEADDRPDGPAEPEPEPGSEPERVAAEAGPPAGHAGHPGDEDPTEVVAMPGLRRSRTGSGGRDRDAPTDVAAMSPVRDQLDRRRQPLSPAGGLASSTGQSPVPTGQSPVSSSGPHVANGGPISSTAGPGGRPLAAAGPPPGRAGSPVRSLAPPPPGNGRSVGAGAVGQLRAVPPGGPASRAGAAAAMGQGAPQGPPARLSPPGGAAPGGSAPGGVAASGGLAPSGGPVPSGTSVSGAVPVERGPRAQPPGQGLSGPPPGLSPSGPGASGPQPAVALGGPLGGPPLGPPLGSPGGPSRPGQGPSGPLPGRPDGVSGFDSPERREPVDPLNGPISSSGGLGYHPPLVNPFGGPDSSTFDSSALWAPSSDTGGSSGWLPATPLPAGAPLYGAGPGHDADEESVREWMAEPDLLERPVASLGGDPLGLGPDVLPIGNPFESSSARDDSWRNDSPRAEADDFHDSGFGSGASLNRDSGSPDRGSFESDTFESDTFEESSARGRDDDTGDDEPDRGEARADRHEPSDPRDLADADYDDEDGYDSEYDDAAEPGADDRYPERRGGEPARSGARGADDGAAARADDMADDRAAAGTDDRAAVRADDMADDGGDDGFGWPEFDEPDAAADGSDDRDGPPAGGSPDDGGPGKGRRDKSRQPREAAAGY